MKSFSWILLVSSLIAGSAAYAGPVKDWRDLDAVHNHVKEALNELARAAKANHYDMQGHAANAEGLLRQAEQQLNQAVQAAKTGN